MIGLNDIAIEKSHRKTIAIRVNSDGSVSVKAPKFIPNFVIENFIKSKKDWIEERQQYIKSRIKSSKKFENGEKFVYLGKEYSLQLGPYVQIEIKDDNLLFPLALAKRGKDIMEKWYIKQAKMVIRGQIEHYSKLMDLPYKSVSFSDTRSKWGSCTHDNRLQFNWRLIMAPLLVLRYVVIHELVHTEEKNHNAIFWNKVRKYNPSYKNQIKWLKEHGNSLRI